MRWKTCFCLSLLSFCCLASLQWTFAAVTTEPSVSAEVEETTDGASPEKWKYPRKCYVEKSKVDELIVQMNSTVRVLNRDDEYLQCQEKLKIVEADNMEICTEERIRGVQKDLFEVAGCLFKLAVRLTEPAEEEVRSLDLKKIRLIHDLNALHVFYGPSPCDSHSIAIFPFASLVEHLEWNLAQILVLFQTPRPTRPPPRTTPAPPTTTSKPTAENMLNPEKSLSELTEMARLNPAAMSKAVPRIISQRYNERASTFDKLLTFAQGLPTEENRVFGLAAIYDEMHRYIRQPEFSKLSKLAESVKTLNESASTTPNFADTTAHQKLVDLIRDLSPIAVAMATTSAPTTTTAKPKPSLDEMISPEKSFLELTQMAKWNPSAMTKAIPHIVSQRYNERTSTFEKLVTFVQGLPTNENKIFGFAAIHDEMYRYKRNPDMRHLLELKDILNRLNDSSESASQNFAGAAASVKLADLIRDLSSVQTTVATTTSTTQKPVFDRMLNPEISFAELIRLSKSNPSLMSKALPKIVSQRYSRRVSTFDSLFEFVNAMPTTEDKIIGFSAVYDEMHGHNQKPEKLQLEKLAKHVRLVISSAPTTLNIVARSKLDELAEDADLNPFNFILSSQWSLQELSEIAQSNSSAMSMSLPEIISQRYNASDSQFEGILNFVESLPTTENKIIGFVAVHDEMHRQNETTNLAKLLQLAKKMKILKEDDQTTSTFANPATALKWTNLIRELSPLMLIGEKANCQVTNVAYRTQLTANDNGYPESAYVLQDQSFKSTVQIYPAIQNYKLVFRIMWSSQPLFASDTNTNTNPYDTIYQPKSSERYVLNDSPGRLPANAEVDWKIVPVHNKANQFRILSAKSDDFMFAHKSATVWNNTRRRVLLGRKSFTEHDHIINADLWTLNCKPGTFSIPTI